MELCHENTWIICANNKSPPASWYNFILTKLLLKCFLCTIVTVSCIQACNLYGDTETTWIKKNTFNYQYIVENLFLNIV